MEEEYDETREKVKTIMVKFLRLAHRLGQTTLKNVVVCQVLHRLVLSEHRRNVRRVVGAFNFDEAIAMAENLEAACEDHEQLDFSCTIMLIGKTGVGKTATINSIFDEANFKTNAFHLGTTKVEEIVGTVEGIKVRLIDTPGLSPSLVDQQSNKKILQSVKSFIKKTQPDIVLYVDRLDMHNRDFNDMPLLCSITQVFGPSIWFNAIVVLTHAASPLPEDFGGRTCIYDMFVTWRINVVQLAIRHAAGDMRLMNPVSLVENNNNNNNNSACSTTNRDGQRMLPNGLPWKPHLLLQSFAAKILAEANDLLKLEGRNLLEKPFLLSIFLQLRPQLNLPEEQFSYGESLDDESEDEFELDDLPPFKPLTKAQVGKLSKAHKKAYFDELEYREKLLMKKQLKEEKRQGKMAESANLVPVPDLDLVIPASFDSDNPTHLYRSLESPNQWLVKPCVLETQGCDHSVGYEGLNVERLFLLKDKIPLSFTGQVTKDKNDANVHMTITSSIDHGKGKATSLGFVTQNVKKDLAYTLCSKTRFANFRRNKASVGLTFTSLGDALSAGMKIEDKLFPSKQFNLVINGGATALRGGDIAYEGGLMAQLSDKDYPLGRFLSTLGVSVLHMHGVLVFECNVQSHIPVGRHTNLVAKANLNNRGKGKISIRLNSSEQFQIALIGIIPLLKNLVGYLQKLKYGQW